MLEKVKQALRVTVDVFDAELQMLIDAAEEWLADAGISIPGQNDDVDPLVDQAIVLYCKKHFGYLEANEADRVERAFSTVQYKLMHRAENAEEDDV